MAKELELIRLEQETAIAAGLLSGVSIVNKFGRNPDIDSGSTPEDVWGGGGVYNFLSAAETITAVSDSALDTSAGTGARTIEVQGLDSNYELQTEEVILNGTTPAALVNQYLRIFRSKVLTAGTGEVNAGTITIAGTTQTQAVISAGQGQTLMAIYTVPAGKTAYLKKIYSSLLRFESTQETAVKFLLQVRPYGGAWNVKHSWGCKTDGDGSYNRDWLGALIIGEKSDIRVRVEYSSSNNADVSSGFDLLLVDA
ncbi:MAG: hypothetical protein GY782_09535 [Gammaproteobacteria bacterium]|nr:hypothetical protein [Gammaproteobacteria bacterium]